MLSSAFSSVASSVLFGALVESTETDGGGRRQRRRMRAHSQVNLTVADEDDVGTFWHVTDWHLNDFQPMDPNPCDMCRSSTTASSRKTCKQPPVGPHGHVECDPPASFWREAVELMKHAESSPDFILAGGDWIGHVPKHMEGPSALRSAATLLAVLLHEAFPRVPTLHALGNHDTWPYYSASASTWMDWEEGWRSEPRLGAGYVAAQFPDDALALWRGGGYYARVLWQQHHHPHPRQQSQQQHRLWGLVLNTNDLAITGGARQCRWLARTLSALRAAGDTAIVLGHIPPGPSHFELDSICARGHYYQAAGGACWEASGQARLLHMLTSYADVVSASFFGHHHTDSVRVLTDSYRMGSRNGAAPARGWAERARGGGTLEEVDAAAAMGGGVGAARHVMYLTPALTPRNPPHPPSLRLYRYSRRTGAPIDFVDYTIDLEAANARTHGGGDGGSGARGGNVGGNGLWRRVASALHSPPLNLSALTPTEWQRALRRLLDADHRPTATDELSPSDPFFDWVSAARCAREAYVGSGRKEVPPLRKCKLAHLCAALHVDDAGYAACIGQPLRPQ